jgi:hypothetical protein
MHKSCLPAHSQILTFMLCFYVTQDFVLLNTLFTMQCIGIGPPLRRLIQVFIRVDSSPIDLICPIFVELLGLWEAFSPRCGTQDSTE